jgi:hypothetical protein
MARKILILMVISFWAVMTGLFIKTHYLVHRGEHRTAQPVLLDSAYRMGVYYGTKRIGEFHFSAYPWGEYPDRGYRLLSNLDLKYPLIGEAYITGQTLTDENLSLQEFQYSLRYKLKMFDEQDVRLRGTVQDGKLLLKVRWGTMEKSFEMPAEEGISLYDPITPWIVGGKFHLGREYTVDVLNRLTQRRQVAMIKVLRRKRILFEGKEIPGYEVETSVGDLKSMFWIGRDGRIYRMNSPVGFSLVREALTP